MVRNISDRLGKLQSEFIDMILNAKFENPYRRDLRDYLLAHSNSCCQLAKILAMKRGTDVEIAAIIGLIHDIGKVLTGQKKNHAADGYLPARELLNKMGGFSEEEIDLVSNAVKNHSDKPNVGIWADEIAKDVDVIDCDLMGMKFDKEAHNERIKKVKEELGID